MIILIIHLFLPIEFYEFIIKWYQIKFEFRNNKIKLLEIISI